MSGGAAFHYSTALQSMRQKQRLLALLIAFPVTFFALLAFMSWKVAKAPVSRVVDIRTVGIPGASSQASSLPDHGMPADTARAEDAVRAFFRRGGRVVVVLMHPVSRFLDMQLPYLLRMQRPDGTDLDRTRIVSEVRIYISDGDDIKGKELWELCQRFRGYLVSVYNRNPADKTACGVFAEHTAEDTIYVRLAASLSYLHEEAVFHLASHKLMHPEHLLVSGNVINNRDIVGLHESRGVFELGSVWNEVRYEEGSLLEEMGLDRALARSELPSPPFMFPKGRDIPAPYAYLQHVYFLRALRQRNSASLDKYRFGRMDFESAGIDAWTPDVVAYAGWDVVSDFSRRDCDQFPTYVEAHPDQPRSGISRLDHYLTSPRGFGLRSGRSSVAVGEALAVVLITHTQHMVFRRQQPFEPFDLQPRQTIGYEMDGTTAMDPFFDAAMWILGDQIQVGDDDTIENAVSKQAIPDPVGDDGVRLPIVSEADANPAHLSARDMVGYVGGDPELLASQEPPRDPNFDGERLEKAREHVAAGGRFGVQCEPGTEGVASLQGRFSQFGCYGWLEDRVMGRFQMLSDRLYQQVDGVYEPPPQ